MSYSEANFVCHLTLLNISTVIMVTGRELFVGIEEMYLSSNSVEQLQQCKIHLLYLFKITPSALLNVFVYANQSFSSKIGNAEDARSSFDLLCSCRPPTSLSSRPFSPIINLSFIFRLTSI
ncbi:hypothetical protein T4B_9750 [Trichinella pseudospiralis]|uniref:Uncharacterized protein n=1 Tax=Trichinella pseudospiralis TaxID=6337 RepID=A0A0V1I2H2_TRIPS|nr:hypothetical protein T4B_9750 [Trichinella pseudospiralis]